MRVLFNGPCSCDCGQLVAMRIQRRLVFFFSYRPHLQDTTLGGRSGQRGLIGISSSWEEGELSLVREAVILGVMFSSSLNKAKEVFLLLRRTGPSFDLVWQASECRSGWASVILPDGLLWASTLLIFTFVPSLQSVTSAWHCSLLTPSLGLTVGWRSCFLLSYMLNGLRVRDHYSQWNLL